jgi:hypothetical protein
MHKVTNVIFHFFFFKRMLYTTSPFHLIFIFIDVTMPLYIIILSHYVYIANLNYICQVNKKKKIRAAQAVTVNGF